MVKPNPIRGVDVASWGVEEVEGWLMNNLSLPKQAEIFAGHKIDGPTLLQLSAEDLQQQSPHDFQDWIAIKKIIGHVKIFRMQLGQEYTTVGGDEPMSARPARTFHQHSPRAGQKAAYASATSLYASGESLSARGSNPSLSRSAREAKQRPYTSQSTLRGDPDHREYLGPEKGSIYNPKDALYQSTFDTRPKSQKGTFGMAPRQISECLYLKGGASPGVCRYHIQDSDPNRKRGGVIGRASRWDRKKTFSERPPPGPMSYNPNFLVKSRARF